MNRLILGNVVALTSSLLMVYSGTVKEKRKIIYIQTIHIFLAIVSDLILNGITGAIVNTISMVRNILCYKDKLGKKEKIIIIALSTVLSLMYNNLGLIGLLPLISTVVYTYLMNIKDVEKFKLLNIFVSILWLIYDLMIKSYIGALFDAMTIVANIFSIIFIRNKSRKGR